MSKHDDHHDTIKCPHCGHDTDKHHAKCDHCGHSIAPGVHHLAAAIVSLFRSRPSRES